MANRQLTHAQARRFYDRFGARQDSQGFYENAALEVLLREGDFANSKGVFEFGCGTGRLGEMLLQGPLRPNAAYFACDISATMVALAKSRLGNFGSRVEIWQSDGPPEFAPAGDSIDRIVATYVLDLLAPDEIATFLQAAANALPRDGRLCCVGLTRGTGILSRVTAGVWQAVARLRPQLVGGCRPLELTAMLPQESWRVLHRSVVTPWTVPSEIVVAARI